MAVYNGYGPSEYETRKQIDEMKSKIKSLEAESESLQLLINEREEDTDKFRKATIEEIKLLRSKLEDQSETIDKLEAEIKKLKEIHKNDEKDYDRLYVSQLAFLFEQAVCSYVLPDVFKDNRLVKVQELLDHLNGGVPLPLDLDEAKEAKILRDGRRRWEEVCDNLQLPVEWKTRSGGWKCNNRSVPPILRAIGYLKKDRVTVAHPSPIKLSVAKEMVESGSIKEQYTDWQYKLIKKFICCVPEYLKKGNLHHDDIDVN